VGVDPGRSFRRPARFSLRTWRRPRRSSSLARKRPVLAAHVASEALGPDRIVAMPGSGPAGRAAQ